MPNWSVRSAAALVAIVLAVTAGCRWWASDERAVRKQLSVIAQSLTVKAKEGDLDRLARLARLRKALAPDIRVSSGPVEPEVAPGRGAGMLQEIVGRDAIVALVGQWTPPAGGMKVELVDLDVKVGDSGAVAEVRGTAKITLRDASGQKTIDAREMTARFAKVEGEWVVTGAHPEETLIR